MRTFLQTLKRAVAIPCTLLGLALMSCGEFTVQISPGDGELVHAGAANIVPLRIVMTNTPDNPYPVTYWITMDAQPASCDQFGSVQSGPGEHVFYLYCPVASEGSHRFEITINAGPGNQARAAVTLDVEVPLKLRVSRPNPGQRFTTNGVSVEFSALNATGALTQTCQLDSGPATACTSPRVYSGLSEGAHTLVVTAKDSLESASDRVSFLVNTTGFSPAPAKQIAVGYDHSCALLTTGKVRCWGYVGDGALGYGNTNGNIGDDEFPSSAGDVDVGGEVVQIAAGGRQTCALLANGKVRCWGYGGFGALGYGNQKTIGDDETPASAGDVDVGGPVVQIAVAQHALSHTCALLATGKVRCWGYNRDGQLGYGHTNTIGDDETPASAGDVDVGGPAVQIAVSPDTTCALLANGKVRCWGYGGAGWLGYGNLISIGDNEAPASAGDIPLGAEATQITASCAALANGNLRCWGGARLVDNHFEPLPNRDFDVGGPVTKVFEGHHSICALLATGVLRCYTDESWIIARPTDEDGPWTGKGWPDVDAGGSVQEIAIGSDVGNHSCSLLTTGQVRCWGSVATYGALGYANTQSSYVSGTWLSPAQTGDVFLGL